MPMLLPVGVIAFGEGAGIGFAAIVCFATFCCIGDIGFGDHLAFATDTKAEHFDAEHLEANVRVVGNAHPDFHHVFNVLEGKSGKVEDLYLTVCGNGLVGISCKF
jgi:hypothetical protein